ncbi:MAG: arylesterase [Candidatus Wallbacteria bacterium]|nr:arylesterase [Candidatus Wallbacteria bacterium]
MPRESLRSLLLLALSLSVSSCAGPETPRVTAPDRPLPPSVAAAGRLRVVFLGDSLTAGHALDRSQAFPALVQQRIDAASLPFEAVNAGVSGDTTADGLRRLEWALAKGADLVVLELGANDGIPGLDLIAARKNMAEIIHRVQSRGTPVLLLGMKLPPNYGPDYTERFGRVFPSLAAEFGLQLVPFLMEGVGGHPDLLLPDGIHPNANGQQRMAETVWKTLEPVLRRMAARIAAP